MEEIWKEISGYEGQYQISSLGNVRSKMKKNEFIMKKSIDSRGYEQVKFYDKKSFLIHHLVLHAFGELRPNKTYECNHKDGNKLNNQISNLEWVTRSENMLHAYSNGLNYTKGKKGEDNPNKKLNESEVLKIRSSNLKNVVLSKIYNVSQKTISKIKLNLRWKHI